MFILTLLWFYLWLFVCREMVGLSVGEKHFIKGGIAQDLRTDGRKRLSYRPIFVDVGVIPQVRSSFLA